MLCSAALVRTRNTLAYEVRMSATHFFSRFIIIYRIIKYSKCYLNHLKFGQHFHNLLTFFKLFTFFEGLLIYYKNIEN